MENTLHWLTIQINMYEKKHQPLLPFRGFVRRVLKNFLFGTLFIFVSLFIGIAGYHWICNFSWINSLLNASMILGGMGPVDPVVSDGGKIFASFYAIFSGIAFLSSAGVMIAPIVHRFMHRFHIRDEKQNEI
jgi:hypothetical protein